VIPLGDADRRRRHVPLITLLIISVNAAFFALELAGGNAFVTQWTLVPHRLLIRHDWLTLLTAMFMHAGWLHILGNMLFLWVFGPAIEDAMGPKRYVSFYLLGGLAASVAQIAINPQSTAANLGASGAIAAVMGAFLVTYPRDRIRTLFLFGFFIQIAFVPAILWVGLWFMMQVFSEVASVAQMQGGGVAYMAHIGGFLFGIAVTRFFESRQGRLGQDLTAST
jgi:membrane associated rhomboid family serine protease